MGHLSRCLYFEIFFAVGRAEDSTVPPKLPYIGVNRSTQKHVYNQQTK